MSRQSRERLVERVGLGIFALSMVLIVISTAIYDPIAFMGAALFFFIVSVVCWLVIWWIERG